MIIIVLIYQMRAIVEERDLPVPPSLEEALEVEEQQVFKPVVIESQ